MNRTIVFLTRAFVVFIWVLALHYALHAQDTALQNPKVELQYQ
jgi:fumarate reductase subunit D